MLHADNSIVVLLFKHLEYCKWCFPWICEPQQTYFVASNNKTSDERMMKANDFSLLRTLQCLGARLLEPTSKENQNRLTDLDRAWQILTALSSLKRMNLYESIWICCSRKCVLHSSTSFHVSGVAPSFNLTLDATDLEAGYRYLHLDCMHCFVLGVSARGWITTWVHVHLSHLMPNCFSLNQTCILLPTRSQCFHTRLCTDLDGPMTSRLKAREPRRATIVEVRPSSKLPGSARPAPGRKFQ